MPPHTMSAWQDAPDLGAYTAQADSDEEVLAELEREVEALNEADADDAERVAGKGRGSDDRDLSQVFEEYRAQRLAEMQAQYVHATHVRIAARIGADTSDPNRGKYVQVEDEKALLSSSVREPKVVIHFAKKEFRRCHILDRHLEHLARQHPGTLFLKTYVEHAPFLVQKLDIRVLPCLMAFVQGVCKDKMIGFQEFGNSDTFTTAALEWRLGQTGTYAPLMLGVILPQQKPSKPILGFGVPTAAPEPDDWD